MYPTLYHVLYDLTGVAIHGLKLINTFGFLVALAFVAAARCLASELARKHRAGLIPARPRRVEPPQPPSAVDSLFSAALMFLLGYKFFGVDPALHGGSDAQRYLLSSQGSLWGGAIVGGAYLAFRLHAIRRQRKAAEPPPAEAAQGPEVVNVPPQDFTLGITGAAALGGLIGAKVFHLLERPRSILELIENPSLAALFSGLTIYGGLIVGTLAVWRYCRRVGLPFVHVCDAVAPGLMLAYGVGRLGCQLAGDGDWGIVNTAPPPAWIPQWFWAFDYPNNVIGAGVPMAEGGYPGFGTHLVPPVYPTPLYETLAAFALFGLLWYLRKRIARPLVLFGAYMMFNGFERFWIEKIRVNATYSLFGAEITQAEIISTLLFVGGAALIWSQQRKPVPAVPAPEVSDEPEDDDDLDDLEDEIDGYDEPDPAIKPSER